MKNAKVKFILGTFSGFIFFLLPVYSKGKITVPFDIAIKFIKTKYPELSHLFTLVLIISGAFLSGVLSLKKPVGSNSLSKYLSSSKFTALLKLFGVLISLMFFFRIGPDFLFSQNIRETIWLALTVSVALIIPVGAIFINYFTKYGGVEFIGTLSERFMKPLFKLPGRAALDATASWIGSYSVALYLTRNIFDEGGYSKRDVFVIATAFSTVSIGFVGVVASTLEILNYFPLIFLGYFFITIVVAAIMVRIPPTNRIPQEYIKKKTIEEPKNHSIKEALRLAYKKASNSPSFLKVGVQGIYDGLILAASILPMIVLVGTSALFLAKKTAVLNYIGLPFYPIYKLLFPEEALELSKATISGLFEMYLPALLSVKLSLKAKVFIALLSTTQIIFFSSIGPMILEMFRDVPIKLSHLIIIFFERTFIIIFLAYFFVSIIL